MNTKLYFSTAIVSLLLIAGFSSTPARADSMDHETIFKFDNAVGIPGQTLAPGTYVFKRLGDDVNVLQIFSQEENGRLHPVATLQMFPEELTTTPDDARVTLTEAVHSSPAKLESWLYPGDSTAEDFVYTRAVKRATIATISIAGTPAS